MTRPPHRLIPKALRAFCALALLATACPAQAEDDLSFREQFEGELTALQMQYGNAKMTTEAVATVSHAIYCVVAKTSLRQTVAFYHDVKTVAEHTKAYCDAHRERDAKQYALEQFTPRQNDPMVKATLECYQLHADELAAIVSDPAKRAQLPQFYRWATNPAAAQSEMTGQELCH